MQLLHCKQSNLPKLGTNCKKILNKHVQLSNQDVIYIHVRIKEITVDSEMLFVMTLVQKCTELNLSKTWYLRKESFLVKRKFE